MISGAVCACVGSRCGEILGCLRSDVLLKGANLLLIVRLVRDSRYLDVLLPYGIAFFDQVECFNLLLIE